MYKIVPCKKCGSEGALKAIANGNMAVLCTNKNCTNSTRAKSGFKGSDRMAVDDWNRRNTPKAQAIFIRTEEDTGFFCEEFRIHDGGAVALIFKNGKIFVGNVSDVHENTFVFSFQRSETELPFKFENRRYSNIEFADVCNILGATPVPYSCVRRCVDGASYSRCKGCRMKHS